MSLISSTFGLDRVGFFELARPELLGLIDQMLLRLGLRLGLAVMVLEVGDIAGISLDSLKVSEEKEEVSSPSFSSLFYLLAF
jgi:hypothetical protein